MCLHAWPPSRLQYDQQCHSHTAPQRSPEDPTQTTSNQHWQTNETRNSVKISNTKMQTAISKQGRLFIFGREGTVEMETVFGEICARLPSVHQRLRGKSSHSGRTWRRE